MEDVNRSGESGSGRRRRRDRDSSPSAHSQSSMMSTALEWDPSADVGTSMNPTSPGNPQCRRVQDTGLSTLERMALNLTSKPQGTLLRSQSEDNTTGELPAGLARRALSMTILELGSVGFERQKQKIPAYNPMKQMMVNYEAKVRSKDSIATVIQTGPRPPNSEVIVLYKTPPEKVDAGTSTMSMTMTDNESGSFVPGRAGFSGDEQRTVHDSQEPSDTLAPGVSDASTDWEYGHSRSHSNDNDSSLSEWQTSGLTRSELEYQKRLEASSGGGTGTGSYSIEVEVQTERFRRSPEIPEQRQRPEYSRIHKGIQTEKYIKIKTKRTPAPPPPRPKSPIHGRRNPHPNHYHESAPLDQTESESYDYEKSSSTGERRRPHTTLDESDPISNSSTSVMSPTCHLINRLVRTRNPLKNQDMMRAIDSHRNTHINKVKKELQRLERLNNVLSAGGGGPGNPPSSSDTTTTSQSTSKESMPRKSTRFAAEPKPKFDQRKSVSTSMRNDLDQRKSVSTSMRNELDQRKSVSTSMRNELDQRKSVSTSMRNEPGTSTALRRPLVENIGTQVPTPLVSATSSATNVNPLELKLDQLLSTFNFIADFLVLNQEAAAEKDKEEQEQVKPRPKTCPCPKKVCNCLKKKETKKCKPSKPKKIKPPVSYFIPFTNCRGQQMYLQYGRPQSPPTPCSSSEKENDDDEENYENEEVESDNETQTRQHQRGGHGRGRYQENTFQGRSSLQEIFEQQRPGFVNRFQQREAVLARMKADREKRAEVKREWIRTHGPHELSSLERALEPKEPRLMTGREMRQNTKKKYAKLPEVQQKKLQVKAEQEKKTNLVMSRLFAKKLSQGARKGNVNRDMNRSIIANAISTPGPSTRKGNVNRDMSRSIIANATVR